MLMMLLLMLLANWWTANGLALPAAAHEVDVDD
jgi:hypothetical protein